MVWQVGGGRARNVPCSWDNQTGQVQGGYILVVGVGVCDQVEVPELFRDLTIRLDCEDFFFFLKRARIIGKGCHFGKRIAFLGLQYACEVLISPCARCSDHILCPVGTHGRDKEFFLIRVCPSWKVRGLPPKAKIYSSSHAKFRLSQSLKISQSSSFFSLGNCVLLPRASNDLGNVPFCISLCSHNACNEALATPRKDPVLYCSVRAAYITGPLPIPAGKRCLVLKQTHHGFTGELPTKELCVETPEITRIEHVPRLWDVRAPGEEVGSKEKKQILMSGWQEFIIHISS